MGHPAGDILPVDPRSFRKRDDEFPIGESNGLLLRVGRNGRTDRAWRRSRLSDCGGSASEKYETGGIRMLSLLARLSLNATPYEQSLKRAEAGAVRFGN